MRAHATFACPGGFSELSIELVAALRHVVRCASMLEGTPDADEVLRLMNTHAHDAAGVDLTQIDRMLALTPAERLQVLYETARSLARLMTHADTD